MTSNAETEFDVVIVGGGPAGASTAVSLSLLDPSLGSRVLMLEKEKHPRLKGCGGAINDEVIHWLDGHGISLSFPPLEMNRIRVVLDRKDPGRDLVMEPAEFYTINREEFDEDLFRHGEKAGAAAGEMEAALSIKTCPEHVLIRTTAREITARVLVGADGAGGVVRTALYRDLGCKSPARAGQTLYCRAIVEGGAFCKEELEAVFDFDFAFEQGIRGYVWSFPTMVKGEKRLSTGIYSYGPAGGGRTVLSAALSRFLSSRGVSPDAEGFQSHPIPGYHPDAPLSGNRILLAGDSAGVDPLLGEGISFALQYGEAAASCILRALDTGDYSFGSYREELGRHPMAARLTRLQETAEEVYNATDPRNWRNILYRTLAS